jgi:hypothetical protein
LFVFAAAKVSVSSGSSIVCILTGKLPSDDVPLNGVLGFNGQRILSETQRESKPSLPSEVYFVLLQKLLAEVNLFQPSQQINYQFISLFVLELIKKDLLKEFSMAD